MQSNADSGVAIPRTRLVEQILSATGLVAVEAPYGFGKSQLAAQLQQIGGAFDASSLTADAAEVSWRNAGSPKTVLCDDAEQLQPLVERLLGRPGGRTVVLGRDLTWLDHRPDVRIGAEDLLFEDVEIQQLAEATGSGPVELLAHFLLPQTAGWPIHVATALAALRSRALPAARYADFLESRPELDALVDSVLKPVSAGTRQALSQLAHFESFPEDAVTALVGPPQHRHLVAAGIPLVAQNDGWFSLVPLVRNALVQDEPLNDQVIDAVVPIFVATGGAFVTSKKLLDAGAVDVAADVLASVPSPYLDTVSQLDALALFRVIQAGGIERPELLLRKARVHGNLAQLEEQAAAVEDALRVAVDQDDRAAAAAAKAEQLYLAAGSLDRFELEHRVEELRTEARRLESSPMILLWCREIEAMAMAHSADLSEVQQSVELLQSVAIEWEHQGDRAHAARTRRVLAATAFNHLGVYHDAITVLERAKALVPDNMYSRALTCEMLARFHALVGDLSSSESAWREASAFAGAVRVPWLTGFLHWAAMLTASLSDDGDGAVWHHVDAIVNLGQLMQHETGLVFRCESAAAFAMLGDADRAATNLEIAIDRREENPMEVALAELVVESRTGDAATGYVMATRLLGDASIPTGRRWRVMVELIAAALRLPELPAEFDNICDRFEQATEALGMSNARGLLLPGQVPNVPTTDRQAVAVDVLGTYSVRVSGRVIEAPTGQVGTLLKVLAVHGGTIPVERIVDWIWPDVEATIGKRRLKNIVRRLRVAVGEHTVVRTDDTIQLAESVAVDASTFEREAGSAAEMAAQDDPLAVATAISALGLYSGDLLPGDLYDTWVTQERDRLRSLATATLEFAIGAAQKVDLPVSWLFETANRLDVQSERVFVNIALLAVSAGLEETARASLARSQELADELGVELRGVEGLEDLISQPMRSDPPVSGHGR